MENKRSFKVIWEGELPLEYIKWNKKTIKEFQPPSEYLSDIKANWELQAQDGFGRETERIAEIDWTIDSIGPILSGDIIHLNDVAIKPSDWIATGRMRLLVSLFHKYGTKRTLSLLQRFMSNIS